MTLPPALDVSAFKNHIMEDAVILDTRHADAFTQDFIPGSVFFGLEGKITEWAGDLIKPGTALLLVTEPGKEMESYQMLLRLGFKNIVGFLQGGMEAWISAGEPKDMIIDIEPDELLMDIPHDPNLLILDVRRQTEFDAGHIEDAMNLPLDEMSDVAAFAGLEERQNLYIHCSRGFRSVMAASILKKHGFHNLRNIKGGWEKIKEEKDIKIEKEKNSLN